MRNALTASLVVLLGLVRFVTGQCLLNGQAFSLPSVGLDNGEPLVFGEFVGLGTGLNSQRGWQMTLCEPSYNYVCNSANKSYSYIYELTQDGQSCDMGLWQMLVSEWNATTAVVNGTSVPAITASFGSADNDLVAVVTVACGGTLDWSLSPVNAADNPEPTWQQPNNGYPGWDVVSSDADKKWTWYIVFQTASLPNNMCNPQPVTAPPTLPPVPAGSCVTSEGIPFTVPPIQLTVPQWVPNSPALSGDRLWQVSLCLPAFSFQCETLPSTYVLQLSVNGSVCEAGLSRQLTNWTHVGEGMLNAVYGSPSNDRIANVTLVCGPTPGLSPVLPSGQDGWLTEKTTSGSWVWHMWFATASLPIC